jgi:OmpA-OmpF porin, OOP family
MSTFNLLDMAKTYFSNELLNKASSHLGESEGGISKVISALIPSVIGTVADKASSSTDNANLVAKLASDQNQGGILSSLGGFLGHDDTSNSLLGKSSGLISSLFGNGGSSNMLTSLISNFAGVKSTSVGTLLSMAVPAILGMLGKHSSENNVSASGLSSLLGEQKKLAMSALPAGFSLESITGEKTNTVNTASSAAASTYHEVEEKAGGGLGKILLPLLLLGGLAAAAYYFINKKSGDATPTTVVNGDTATKKVEGPAATTVVMPKATVGADGLVSYDLGALGDLDLPGGTKLTGVNANGFENTLVNFIKTGTIDTINKGANWFNLHDVQFLSGKTTYATPKAMAQIKNVAAILKAYPNVVIKVGGNTDVSGNAASNVALSQSRAEQVMKDIIASGAGAAQIKEAKGYGSEFATAVAGDKTGMAADRKTTAKVSAK